MVIIINIDDGLGDTLHTQGGDVNGAMWEDDII